MNNILTIIIASLFILMSCKAQNSSDKISYFGKNKNIHLIINLLQKIENKEVLNEVLFDTTFFVAQDRIKQVNESNIQVLAGIKSKIKEGKSVDIKTYSQARGENVEGLKMIKDDIENIYVVLIEREKKEAFKVYFLFQNGKIKSAFPVFSGNRIFMWV